MNHQAYEPLSLSTIKPIDSGLLSQLLSFRLVYFLTRSSNEFQSEMHQFDKSVTALTITSVELIGLSDLPSESLSKATGTKSERAKN